MNFLTQLFSARSEPRRRFPKRRRPTSTPPVVNGKRIAYILNDMTTPDLVKPILPPEQPASPMFTVKKYAGGGFKRGTAESLAAQCFVTLTNTINFYAKHGGKMNRWIGTSNLAVMPKAGKDLNAFYNRRSLQFFYFGHRKIGGTVFTAESSDIVAHELGHAVLDTLRPDTWSAASLEVWAFHEAFADLTAMMNIMCYDEILQRAIEQTGGNLRKPNVIARLAEDVGKAIFALAPGTGRNPDCLRNAINNFKYVPPNKLPKDAPHNKLSSECHSFGRVFLGVYYDLLVAMYEQDKQSGSTPLKALQHARNGLTKRALTAIKHAPLNVKFYESMAKTMLWTDKTKFHGIYQDTMRKVFAKRNIIRPSLNILSNAPACDNDERIMKMSSTLNLKLSDHVLRVQSNNPLYNVEVEIPHEQAFLYDENNNVMDAVMVSDPDALLGAQDMIEYLHETNSVGDGPDTPFEIQNGKLVRTHFA